MGVLLYTPKGGGASGQSNRAVLGPAPLGVSDTSSPTLSPSPPTVRCHLRQKPEGRTYDLLRKSVLRMADFILAFLNLPGRGSGLPSVDPAGRVSITPRRTCTAHILPALYSAKLY